MAYKYIEPTEKTYAKAYKLSLTNAGSINIRTTYSNVDYTALRNADFICSYVSDSNHTGDSHSTGGNRDSWTVKIPAFKVNHSYNPSTGVLTVTRSTDTCMEYKDPNTSGNVSFSNLKIQVIMIVDGVRSQYT